MTLEEFNDVIEFPLTSEIRELGFSRVYTCFNSNKEQLLLVERTGIQCNPIQCKYDKSSIKNTAKELESALTISGVDHKTTRKFIVLLAKLCIEMERQQQKTQRDLILEEIRKRRLSSRFESEEEWQNLVENKYNELKTVVIDNIPEIWSGLEFELSVLRILNISDCNLPFIGLLLSRPSSFKTAILNLLREW
jgi:hypothetical protein